MDPLLHRFATGGRARLAAVIGVVAGVVVLTAAVLIAAFVSGGSESSLPAVAVSRAPSPAPTPLLVQVSGAVRHPGLVSVPDGARVVDAVAAAGGPAPDADQAAINLAAPVADGQQVVVPRRGAAPAAAADGTGAAAGAAKVGLNSATAEQLETLPRIGPALAARILAYRAAHGAFRSIDELGEVGGIGPKTLAGLRDLVTL